MKNLNIGRLVQDLGGAAAVAHAVGVVRTAPYAWVRRGHIRTTVVEKIKTAHPELELDKYFEETTNEDKHGGSA